MSKQRRFSGELKANVALEALRGDRTLQEIASRHQIHPNQVGACHRRRSRDREGRAGITFVEDVNRGAAPAPRAAILACWGHERT